MFISAEPMVSARSSADRERVEGPDHAAATASDRPRSSSGSSSEPIAAEAVRKTRPAGSSTRRWCTRTLLVSHAEVTPEASWVSDSATAPGSGGASRIPAGRSNAGFGGVSAASAPSSAERISASPGVEGPGGVVSTATTRSASYTSRIRRSTSSRAIASSAVSATSRFWASERMDRPLARELLMDAASTGDSKPSAMSIERRASSRMDSRAWSNSLS